MRLLPVVSLYKFHEIKIQKNTGKRNGFLKILSGFLDRLTGAIDCGEYIALSCLLQLKVAKTENISVIFKIAIVYSLVLCIVTLIVWV